MIIGLIVCLTLLIVLGAAVWHHRAAARELDQRLEVARQVRDAQRRLDYIVRRTITEARREALRTNQRSK